MNTKFTPIFLPFLEEKSNPVYGRKESTNVDNSTNTNKNPASKAKFDEKQTFLRGKFTPFLSKRF